MSQKPDELDMEIHNIVRGFEDNFGDIWGNPTVFVGMRQQLRKVFDKYLRKAADEWNQKQIAR